MTVKFRPYDQAHLVVSPHISTRPRLVEVISMPFPAKDRADDTILTDRVMARMVPGEPTTMREVRVANLHTCGQKRYLHVARVRMTTGLPFPTDMLRHDNGWLYHSHMPEDEVTAPVEDGGVLVYTTSSSTHWPWTTERWTSFETLINEVLVRDLHNHNDDSRVR